MGQTWLNFWPYDRLKVSNPLFSIITISNWLNFRPTKNQPDYFFYRWYTAPCIWPNTSCNPTKTTKILAKIWYIFEKWVNIRQKFDFQNCGGVTPPTRPLMVPPVVSHAGPSAGIVEGLKCLYHRPLSFGLKMRLVILVEG